MNNFNFNNQFIKCFYSDYSENLLYSHNFFGYKI